MQHVDVNVDVKNIDYDDEESMIQILILGNWYIKCANSLNCTLNFILNQIFCLNFQTNKNHLRVDIVKLEKPNFWTNTYLIATMMKLILRHLIIMFQPWLIYSNLSFPRMALTIPYVSLIFLATERILSTSKWEIVSIVRKK